MIPNEGVKRTKIGGWIFMSCSHVPPDLRIYCSYAHRLCNSWFEDPLSSCSKPCYDSQGANPRVERRLNLARRIFLGTITCDQLKLMSVCHCRKWPKARQELPIRDRHELPLSGPRHDLQRLLLGTFSVGWAIISLQRVLDFACQ